jgi:Protein of unknown function (DUF2887)
VLSLALVMLLLLTGIAYFRKMERTFADVISAWRQELDMKTDKLFYRLFLSQPDLIGELIPEIPHGCEFAYSAPTIKEKGFALDGLLTPVVDDPSLPLVEAILVNKFPQLSMRRFFGANGFGCLAFGPNISLRTCRLNRVYQLLVTGIIYFPKVGCIFADMI